MTATPWVRLSFETGISKAYPRNVIWAGVGMNWVEGFTICTRIDEGTVTISANREGLLSLANHLMDLAEAAPGGHIHLDEHNSLEEGSIELIIERMH